MVFGATTRSGNWPAGQHRMFSALDGSFVRRKEAYLDPGILHGHRLLESQPLGIDSRSFRTFVGQYDLHLSQSNRNIVQLLEIREEGYLAGFADQREYPASLRSGFSEIDSALYRQIVHGVSQYGNINRSQLDARPAGGRKGCSGIATISFPIPAIRAGWYAGSLPP